MPRCGFTVATKVDLEGYLEWHSRVEEERKAIISKLIDSPTGEKEKHRGVNMVLGPFLGFVTRGSLIFFNIPRRLSDMIVEHAFRDGLLVSPRFIKEEYKTDVGCTKLGYRLSYSELESWGSRLLREDTLRPERLNVDYDGENDVLYISFGEPREADDSIGFQEEQ